MAVGVIKAGHNCFAPAINYFCFWPDGRLKLTVVRHQQDFVAPNHHCPGFWLRRVHSDDIGVFEGEVGGRHTLIVADAGLGRG